MPPDPPSRSAPDADVVSPADADVERLRALLETGGDAALDGAREIGARAEGAGCSVVEIVERYQRALERAASASEEPAGDARRRRVLAEGPRLLRALLSPLEAALQAGRSAREEITALREAARRREEALVMATRELESFAYSVSHDLRAPLRTIDGFSQVLLEDHAEKLDAEGKEYIDHLRSSAIRMGQLIDDLVSLTRIARKEMSWGPVDLGAVAREIEDRLRAEHPERDVEIVIEDGLRVEGDAELLQALLEELLGNAWKFTARRDHARIEVGSRTESGERVYFVRDNGAGFDMRYASKLFGVFQRLHRASDFDGTGVGLARARRIVRRHGGRITAEAELDRGATLSFTLGPAGV